MMWLSISAQLLTFFITLGFLAKEWKDLRKKWRPLPIVILLLTCAAAVVSVVQTVATLRAADRQEAEHKGETKQFNQTLNTLLDRQTELQKQVNTEPLLKQNEKLQHDMDETKKLIQAAKAQLEKPAPKATLEATFAEVREEVATRKDITVVQQADGSVEFTIFVMNVSKVQAKNGSINVRVCKGCTFVVEPERFDRAVGSQAYDREMPFTKVDADVAIAIPLKIMPPLPSHSFEVGMTLRCENCEVKPVEKLHVHY